jgi:hypothetical protein
VRLCYACSACTILCEAELWCAAPVVEQAVVTTVSPAIQSRASSSIAFDALFHSGALVLLLNVALRADMKARRLRDDQREVMLTVVKLLQKVQPLSLSHHVSLYAFVWLTEHCVFRLLWSKLGRLLLLWKSHAFYLLLSLRCLCHAKLLWKPT